MAHFTGVILFSMKFHIADLPLSTTSPTYLPSTAGQVQGTTPSPGTAPSRPSPSPTCGTRLSWRTLMPLHRGQLAHLLPSILSFPTCWPGYKWIIHKDHLVEISFYQLSEAFFQPALLPGGPSLPYPVPALPPPYQCGSGSWREDGSCCLHPLTRYNTIYLPPENIPSSDCLYLPWVSLLGCCS